jgi:hypothetical protein
MEIIEAFLYRLQVSKCYSKTGQSVRQLVAYPQLGMKEILREPDSARAGHLKSLLEEQGIMCFVKNEYVSASPALIDTTPSLWIVNDDDYESALELITQYMDASEQAST